MRVNFNGLKTTGLLEGNIYQVVSFNISMFPESIEIQKPGFSKAIVSVLGQGSGS